MSLTEAEPSVNDPQIGPVPRVLIGEHEVGLVEREEQRGSRAVEERVSERAIEREFEFLFPLLEVLHELVERDEDPPVECRVEHRHWQREEDAVVVVERMSLLVANDEFEGALEDEVAGAEHDQAQLVLPETGLDDLES